MKNTSKNSSVLYLILVVFSVLSFSRFILFLDLSRFILFLDKTRRWDCISISLYKFCISLR